MKATADLVRALRKVTSTGGEIMPAVVKSVDDGNDTCEVDFDGMEIGGVRLQAIVDNDAKSFVLYPKVDSVVIIEPLGNQGEYIIRMYSEIDRLLLRIGTVKLEVKDSLFFEITGGSKMEVKDRFYFKNGADEFEIKNGFLIQKGAETLKKIIDDLIDAISQITVNTNVGVSTVPLNAAALQAIKLRADQLLK